MLSLDLGILYCHTFPWGPRTQNRDVDNHFTKTTKYNVGLLTGL